MSDSSEQSIRSALKMIAASWPKNIQATTPESEWWRDRCLMMQGWATKALDQLNVTTGAAVAFWPHKRRVRFKNCPVGLFMYGDTIALMTEYATERRTDGVISGVNRDAYIVSSGEYFWGGTSDGAMRDELMVTPLTLVEP